MSYARHQLKTSVESNSQNRRNWKFNSVRTNRQRSINQRFGCMPLLGRLAQRPKINQDEIRKKLFACVYMFSIRSQKALNKLNESKKSLIKYFNKTSFDSLHCCLWMLIFIFVIREMISETPWEKAGLQYHIFCLHARWDQVYRQITVSFLLNE